jgi:hypothetical protein
MSKMRQAKEKCGDVMRFTHFSHHAAKRVTQRTLLTRSELASVLDHRLFVHIGNEPGLPREHLLFYSLPDENFFVAVRDKLTGAVVTVLPLEYHENLAWSISLAQMKKAEELACHAAVETEARNLATRKSVGSVTPEAPTSLVVSCIYLTSSGRTAIRRLLKVSAVDYKNDIQTFMHDDRTPALLDNAALEKELDPARVFALAVKLGKDGIPELLDLKDPVWINWQDEITDC